MLWDVSVEPFFLRNQDTLVRALGYGNIGNVLIPMSAQAQESHLSPMKREDLKA